MQKKLNYFRKMQIFWKILKNSEQCRKIQKNTVFYPTNNSKMLINSEIEENFLLFKKIQTWMLWNSGSPQKFAQNSVKLQNCWNCQPDFINFFQNPTFNHRKTKNGIHIDMNYLTDLVLLLDLSIFICSHTKVWAFFWVFRDLFIFQ
jgi:hypothetical protein